MFKYIVLFIGIQVLIYNAAVTAESEEKENLGQGAHGAGNSADGPQGSKGSSGGGLSSGSVGGGGDEDQSGADMLDENDDDDDDGDIDYAESAPWQVYSDRNVSWNEYDDVKRDNLFKALPKSKPDDKAEAKKSEK